MSIEVVLCRRWVCRRSRQNAVRRQLVTPAHGAGSVNVTFLRPRYCTTVASQGVLGSEWTTHAVLLQGACVALASSTNLGYLVANQTDSNR